MQMRGASGEPEDMDFGHKNESICQAALCFTLSSLPLPSQSERGKSERVHPRRQSRLQRPPPHLDLPTSAPYRTPRRGETPSQVRGRTPTVQLGKKHPQPLCPICDRSYLVVGRIPSSGWGTALAARTTAEGSVPGESLSRHCLTLYFDFSL